MGRDSGIIDLAQLTKALSSCVPEEVACDERTRANCTSSAMPGERLSGGGQFTHLGANTLPLPARTDHGIGGPADALVGHNNNAGGG